MNAKILIVFALILIGLVSCEKEEGKRSYFTIEDNLTILNIEQDTYSGTYSISSNTEWKFVNRSGQTWAKITPSSGIGDSNITITAEANEGVRRSALFDIEANGVKNQQITISQDGTNSPVEDNEFPIIAWTDEPSLRSVERFQNMKEAGFNIYLQWYDNLATTLEALEDAEEAGIKMIASCPELKSNTGNTVKAMMNKSALYGYHLDDEPELNEIPGLALWTTNIQSIDSKHPCYINLYPNWAWGGATGYAANVNTFLNQVPASFLSFDNYPIVEINGAPSILRPDWYQNLEDISAATKAKDIPFWAFVLALSHNLDASHFYPIPTLAELRLQVFSNLVYGAQGIQYFTYWGLYHDEPTTVYNRVKTVNQEIRNLSPVFLYTDVISVWHTGTRLPNGTYPIDKLPDPIKSLTTSDNGAVISFLEKGDNQYLAIVNRDYKNSMALTVSLEPSVKQIQKSGLAAETNSGTVQVEAGDIVIYTWKK